MSRTSDGPQQQKDRFGSSRAPTFAPRPDYGRGVMHRRIRLMQEPGQVVAELEDHSHGMRCIVRHDDVTITAIDSHFLRTPMSTCGGAQVALRTLVGLPYAMDTRVFFSGGRARQNCTHMLDLAWLACRHINRAVPQRLYAMEIPDEVAGHQEGTLTADGVGMLRWHVEQSKIVWPQSFAGRGLFNGFVGWALDNLKDEQLESALILQKGFLVASARRFIMPPGALSAADKEAHVGLCYGYGAERVEQAVRRRDAVRDYTHDPDSLLKFL